LRVYFLRDGKIAPFARTLQTTKAVATAALQQLVTGLTTENAAANVTNPLPKGAGFSGLRIVNGVASVEASGDFSGAALADVVYTLTQFRNVNTVEINGKRYTRADFEDETPLILVESPLPFQAVHSPLHATGTANTFEATFDYDLVGPDGKVIAHNFVTATSGSGTRGTFDFTAPFTVSQGGEGKLVVYELSAKDGSRIHEVEIPLTLEP